MRRIAIGAIAALLALPGMAQAFKTSTMQVHNKTHGELVVGFSTADERDHRTLDPGNFLLFDVLNGSCIRIHLPGKSADEPCRETGTPLRLSCDLGHPFSCVFHEGRAKDLVISVLHRGR